MINTPSVDEMTFEQFKSYMDAIHDLRLKIADIGKQHPIVHHYYRMVDEIQVLPFNVFQSYYVKWSMGSRQRHKVSYYMNQ